LEGGGFCMSSIDERIVGMKFDNSQFKGKAQESLKALEDLKKGLNLDAAKKSLAGLAAEGSRFSLAGIAAGVDQIASKFSVMGAAGIAVMATLANKAVNFGISMAQGMFEPMQQGFQEYELKMGSIQTILSNTSKAGTTLDQVTASLDELNNYADKTIYNFGDMTKNIGLFTNAGIGVESATSMIKGFSNEAAASGTNAQGAASAAYQLSQALSAGKITLMDWRSLQNVGMGNANMKSGILDIANAMGTLQDKGVTSAEVQKDFNGTLEKGWLTADVMSSYLQIMAGDMDAAAQKSLGLSDAQIEAFSKQQKIAEEAATKVRTFTQLVGTMKESVGSSWSETFELVLGNFDTATEFFTGVNDKLGAMVSASGKARNDLLQGWNDLGGRDLAIEGLWNVFDALMGAIKPIQEAFREIFPPMTAQKLYDITKAIVDFTAKLKLGDKDSENLKNTFKGLFAIVNIGLSIIKGALGLVGRLFGAFGDGDSSVLAITGSLGLWLSTVSDAVTKGEPLKNFFKTLGDILTVPVDLLKGFGKFLASAFDSIQGFDLSGFEGIFGRLQARLASFGKLGGIVADGWKGFTGWLSSVGTALAPFFGMVGEAFGKIKTAIGDAFKSGDFSLVLDAINTGLFAGIVLLIKKFMGSLTDAIGGEGGGFKDSFKEIIGGVTGSLTEMQNSLKAKTLLTIAIAIGILAASLLVLSLIDSDKLTGALLALSVTFGLMVGSLSHFAKVIESPGIAKMPLVAASMILLAVAVVILASAVKMLAELDWNELAKGLLGLTVIMALLVGVSQKMSKESAGMIASGTAMIVMAVGVKILASAVTDLAALSWADLAKGLLAVGAVLGALMLFNKFGKVGPASGIQAVGILLLAGALKVLASATKDFSTMQWDELARGLVGMAGGLVVIGLAMKLMPKNMIVSAIALTVVSAALLILSDALKSMGSMSWEEIAKAGVVLAGSLALIAGGLYIMSGALPGAAALVVASAALVILAAALKEMAKLGWEEIGKVMTILAGSLIILAVGLTAMVAGLPGAAALVVAAGALAVLTPVLAAMGLLEWDVIGKGLLVLAAALAVLAIGGMLLLPAVPGLLGLGAAILLIGGGVYLAAIGIGLLSAALVILVAAGSGVPAMIGAIVRAILEQIPYAMEQFALGIVAFANVIATSGTSMTEAFTTIIQSFLDSINTLSPQIIDTMWDLLIKLATKIEENMPVLVEKGGNIITSFLRGMAAKVPGIASAATDLIIAFIRAIGTNSQRIVDAGMQTILQFINGLTRSVNTYAPQMRQAGLQLAMAIVDGMTGGLASGAARAIRAAADMAGKALQAAKDLLGIASPSKEFFKIGAWSAEGAANGIDKNAYKMSDSASDMGSGAMSALQSSIDSMADVVANGIDSNPVISPVLDLSEFKKDASLINGMMPTPTVTANRSYGEAANIQQDYASLIEAKTAVATAPSVQNISLTQNNTSPKALSHVELYRQTDNQLAAAKGALQKKL
jgi:tape measure domain-containing protein